MDPISGKKESSSTVSEKSDSLPIGENKTLDSLSSPSIAETIRNFQNKADELSKKSSDFDKKNLELDKKTSDLETKVNQTALSLGWAILLVIVGLTISLVGVGINIYKDFSHYNNLQYQVNFLTEQNTKLRENYLSLHEDSIDIKFIINCLKERGEKYWKYSECLK